MLTVVLIGTHVGAFLFGYLFHKLITSKLKSGEKAATSEAQSLIQSAEAELKKL